VTDARPGKRHKKTESTIKGIRFAMRIDFKASKI
jgi:hypothetical protein